MKKNIFKITFLGVILISPVIYSQEKSEIIISEENLISLIKTIRTSQNESLISNSERNFPLDNYYGTNNKDYKFESSKSLLDDNKSFEIKEELNSLKNEVRLLKEIFIEHKKNTQNTKINTDNNKIITLPVDKIESTPVVQENKTIKEQSSSKLDSLYNVIAELKNSFKKDKTVKKEIVDTVSVKVIKKSINEYNPEVYNALLKKYGSYKEQVYFENNSSKITILEMDKLDEIYNILKTNPTIDIYLKGFTSNRGSIKLNEALALKRAEQVKLYFISKGIAPLRIISNHYGIDYSKENETLARRVEITFLIRR